MENKKSEIENKRKAAAFAAIFHLIFFLLFAFYGLNQPNPIPQEQGIQIALDFGNSEVGSGDNPTSTPSPNPQPIPEPEVQEVLQPQPELVQAQEVTTQVSSPVETNVTENKTTVEEPKAEPKKLNETLKNALTDAFTKTGGGSKGDGADNQEGNKGDPKGGDGRGVFGNGSGSWELAGRNLLKSSRIEDTKEEGTVVLNIWVDRSGNVVRTSVNFEESNTTSSYLVNIASKAAKQYKYSAQENASVEQKGKMTFIFILK